MCAIIVMGSNENIVYCTSLVSFQFLYITPVIDGHGPSNKVCHKLLGVAVYFTVANKTEHLRVAVSCCSEPLVRISAL